MGKAGIAPSLVASQIEGTASWLRAEPRAAEANAVLASVPALDAAFRADPEREETQLDYLHLLLTAHWATVATFVPTDVDARIRHHAWMAMEDPAMLARGCDRVDTVAKWDASLVSARVVRGLSGHDGEWLGVRAGALGRAATLSSREGATEIVDRLVAELDATVDRHERLVTEAMGGDARTALSIATIVAHNLGDLSRVVEAWPKGATAELRAKYTRLGHADAPLPRKAFVAAGALNKAVMALENHRFLALRKARCLRVSRSLLLPIGPWFDAWGEQVATEVEPKERADVAAALLELHLSSPDQLGCLRALAGIHRATRGGLEALAGDVPARLRKEIARGRVREALDVSAERFEARIEKRFVNARSMA